MRHRLSWLFALSCVALLAARAARADEPKRPMLAVLEFLTKLPLEDQAAADKTYFSDVVRAQALDELPDAQLMTRENMLVLLAASGKDLAACEGECVVCRTANEHPKLKDRAGPHQRALSLKHALVEAGVPARAIRAQWATPGRQAQRTRHDPGVQPCEILFR